MEDFRQTWKLLSVYLKMEITDEAISDLAITIDSNQDGSIDIDEFMEAFRLTDKKSRLERGRSMFMGTATDLTKLDVDSNIWARTADGKQRTITAQTLGLAHRQQGARRCSQSKLL